MTAASPKMIHPTRGAGLPSSMAAAVSVDGGVGAAPLVPTAASTAPVGVGAVPSMGRTPPPGVDVAVAVGASVAVAVGASVAVAVGA